MKLATFERTRTMALLYRFLRTSLSVGRMPSLVGREVFRARVGPRPAAAFENAVLFVCDVEKCIAELEPIEQRLIAYCVLEDRSEWEASRQFRASQGFISRHLSHALDYLYLTFCRRGILSPLPDGLSSSSDLEISELHSRRPT